MMRKVERDDLLDYQTYSDRRDVIRQEIMKIKRPRRLLLGEYLTFLFENTDTVRYQVQEMMRAEQIVREEAIQHELDTYNTLLGGPGELGCALLIGIEDPGLRATKLRAWLELPRHVYARMDDGQRVRPRFDDKQIGEDRLSAVQYLVFATGGRVPVAIGSDLPDLTIESELTTEQRAALAVDLAL